MKSAPDVDALVLSYLNTVETYQAQTRQLSQYLADGFLQLAEANFHAPPGRRYGNDYYDGRMTALRGIEICEKEASDGVGSGKRIEIGIRRLEDEKRDGDGEESAGQNVPTMTVRQRKLQSTPQSPPATNEYTGTDYTQSEADQKKTGGPTQEQTPVKPVVDPIRWFGVLTPSPLRSAQTSFTASLPAICGVLNTLRTLSIISRELHIYKLLPSRPQLPLPDILPLSQLDSDSGYVHLCAAGQARGVIERFMSEAEEVWLLRIPLLRVHGDLKWEVVGDVAEEVFPHLFASLERGHIAGVGRWVEGGIEEVHWEELNERGMF